MHSDIYLLCDGCCEIMEFSRQQIQAYERLGKVQ